MYELQRGEACDSEIQQVSQLTAGRRMMRRRERVKRRNNSSEGSEALRSVYCTQYRLSETQQCKKHIVREGVGRVEACTNADLLCIRIGPDPLQVGPVMDFWPSHILTRFKSEITCSHSLSNLEPTEKGDQQWHHQDRDMFITAWTVQLTH